MTHDDVMAKLRLLFKKVHETSRDFSRMNWVAQDQNGGVYVFIEKPICVTKEQEWVPSQHDNDLHKAASDTNFNGSAVSGFYAVGNSPLIADRWVDTLTYIGDDPAAAEEFNTHREYETYEY